MAKDAGMFSKIGSYIKDLRNSQASYAVNNWARYGAYGVGQAWNTSVGKGAIMGGVAGGLYGATGNDTSVLGGDRKSVV